MKLLEEQNERVLSLLAKLPGAATPINVEPRTGFQASPFVDEIALIDVPKKYNIPSFMPKYYGITDPVEHIAQYKQLIWTTSIPHQYQEVCVCKSVGSEYYQVLLMLLSEDNTASSILMRPVQY